MAKGGLIMKQKVLAKAVAMVMVFLFTGCMPSVCIEGKIVKEVDADNETKEDLIEVNTELMNLPTAVSPPFASDRKEAQKAIAIILLVLLHHSGKPNLR